MEVVKFVSQSLEDARAGIPIIEGISQENVTEFKDVTVALLESGTVNGNPSMMFILKGRDGQHMVGEITMKHFDGLIAAVRGTLERWENEKA